MDGGGEVYMKYLVTGALGEISIYTLVGEGKGDYSGLVS